MMDYHELINELSYEDNPCVLDYIDDAVEMLEHLHSEPAAANARCETLSKMVTQYQDELIPGYRERAEKAERERDAAIKDLRACHIEPCDTCKHASAPPKWCEADCESCQWESCRCRDCIGGASQWEWRGVRKEQKT